MPSWTETLQEVQLLIIQGRSDAFDQVRRGWLKRLSEYSGRNTIAYYSGWMSKPGIEGTDISDEDKHGFMSAIHGTDRKRGLDLIIHTPGGNIAATQSIVDYLHRIYGNDIRAVVPQLALSAGTMLACSCKEILMGAQSSLGPIDPQYRGIPTYGVIQEFNRAVREVKKDPSKAAVWQVVIGQYRPTFLGQCANAIKWSNEFVRDQLQNVMYAGDAQASTKAAAAVKRLTDYTGNRTHDRHIAIDECEAIGLKIYRLEQDQKLQDLVLSVHHCFMITFAGTGALKIIENERGVSYVKGQVQQLTPSLLRTP